MAVKLKQDSQTQLQTKSKKIIIFYSSIGKGHLSAAQAIRQEIIQLNPSANIILYDIRLFMNFIWREIDKKLYWFIVSNFSESFDTLFHSMQKRGNSVQSLSLLPNDYPEEKVLKYIESQTPDTIIATHYGAAQVLGILREKGLLPNIKIGWLHTDFFEGYFPRISKRIDQTFLAHPELEIRWLAAGVPQDKISTTGMPVSTPTINRGIRHKTLEQLALRPDLATILITNGKEGVGHYCAIVENIAGYYKNHIQIIAVCGNNIKLQTRLATLSKSLPPRVTLKILGLLPRHDMISLMSAVDLLITKAGGMTPAEAFAIGLPTILLDVISGHERENAAMFVELGLAKFSPDITKIGEMAAELLANSEQLEAMVNAQHNFSKHIKISKIAEFALNDSSHQFYSSVYFGTENGMPVMNINETLNQLDIEASADIEILLSYSISKSPQLVVLENPFGHIALRIGRMVYSTNYIADRRTDHNFLQHISLADYIYGVRRPSPTQIHTNTYGMAYGRETIGLRVLGISKDQIRSMMNKVDFIEEQFRVGSLSWNKYKFNCADAVAHILMAGGYNSLAMSGKLGFPAMPLDIFIQAQASFKKYKFLQTSLVAYRQVPGAQADYHFSRFPLSPWKPLRSTTRIISDSRKDPIETAISKQVVVFGQRRLLVDSFQINNIESDNKYSRLALAFIADLRRLFKARVMLSNKKTKRSFAKFTAEIKFELKQLIAK